MDVYAANDRAGNGVAVNTTVRLLWEEGEPFADRPFFCSTSVDGCSMAHSHHRTAAAAKDEARKMHAAYLEVHSKTELELVPALPFPHDEGYEAGPEPGTRIRNGRVFYSADWL